MSSPLLILPLTVGQLQAHPAYLPLGLRSTVATGTADSTIRVATVSTGQLPRAAVSALTTCTSIVPSSVRHTTTVSTTDYLFVVWLCSLLDLQTKLKHTKGQAGKRSAACPTLWCNSLRIKLIMDEDKRYLKMKSYLDQIRYEFTNQDTVVFITPYSLS